MTYIAVFVYTNSIKLVTNSSMDVEVRPTFALYKTFIKNSWKNHASPLVDKLVQGHDIESTVHMTFPTQHLLLMTQR